MPLFHRKPVVVQRVYVKPSTMDRLRALFAGRRRAYPSAYPQRRMAGPTAAARPRRAPVARRRGGMFGRRHRQYVATNRRHHRGPSAWRRLKYSLRPRRRVIATTAPRRRRPPAVAQRPRQPRTHHSKGRLAALLALMNLQKHRHSHPHRRRHLFHRHHRMARPAGAQAYVY